MIKQSYINQLDSMYPSFNYMLEANSNIEFPEYARWGSIYGYSFGDNKITIGTVTHSFVKGQYFSLFLGDQLPKFECSDKLFLVCKLGYKAQNVIGWVENQGRLTYIDGCTDSLLVYPPRQGDPSLNFLYFPLGIEQTRHLHPSIRFGCVIAGKGISDVWDYTGVHEEELSVGVNFCLEENELHCFRTTDSDMTVIAWHPDGDWGPTDHNHTMLNRTYVNK
jgi:hypothetical protein